MTSVGFTSADKVAAPAAIDITSANPQFGGGGLPQLFVPTFKSSLETIDVTPLGP